MTSPKRPIFLDRWSGPRRGASKLDGTSSSHRAVNFVIIMAIALLLASIFSRSTVVGVAACVIIVLLFIVAVSIDHVLHKRRLRKMREEADAARDARFDPNVRKEPKL